MEDRDIIQLYMQRDEAAIKATAEKYGAYCSRIAGNILLSEEDIDECLSDTWLRIWNLIPPYNPTSLKVFAGKITRGFAVNRCRASLAGKRTMGQYALALEELEDVVQAAETVETEVDAKIIAASISDFLRGQNKLHADIFVRRYFYLDPVAVIARAFAISESKTKSILFRMRKKLRTHLEKEELI